MGGATATQATVKRAFSWDLAKNKAWGDINGGQRSTLLTCDLKQSEPECILTAGEDLEVHTYKTAPPAHVKSFKGLAGGFINRLALTPWDQGAHYVVVSADKTITLVNTASGEVVAKQEGAHKMGIIDVCFAEEWEILTSSSDATIK